MFRIAATLVFSLFLLALYAQEKDRDSLLINQIERRYKQNPDSCIYVLRKLQNNKPENASLINCLMGECYLQKKLNDSAMMCFRETERLEKPKTYTLGRAYFGMGLIAYNRADYRLARYYFLKSGQSLSAFGINGLICQVNNELGNTFLALNQLDSAGFYYHETLNLAEKLGDQGTIARTFNNLSIASYKLGNFEKAVEWQIRAVKIKEQMPDTVSLATSLNNVGSFFIKLNNYQDARRFLHRAYRILTEKQSPKIKGYSALNLGISYKMLEQYDSAVYFYNKALEIYQTLGAQANIGKIYSNLGGLYEAKQDYDQALNFMKLSLEIAKTQKLNYEAAIRNRNIANVYLLKDQPENAKDYILEAHRLSEEVKSTELSMEVDKTLADYYEKTRNFEQALKYFKEFKSNTDSLFTQGSLQNINELNVIYETEKKEKNIINLLDQQRIRDLTIQQKEDALFQQKLVLFSTILVALLLMLAGYIVFLRFRLREKNARVALARQKADLEQRMLLSQMNPHFIFNSLGSVQNYIGRNEPQAAQQFLMRFAKLMRSILENSRRQFIPLEEEKEALRLYLELEQQRFPGRFSYKIEVIADEPDFILIPPMMVQPFVENAILHAFKNPEQEGLLQIEYQLEDELIKCTITDNGVGRNKSLSEKPEKSGHNSLGSKVVEERIDLLRKEYHSKASLFYEDLSAESSEVHGTRVILYLPFQERDT